MSSSSLAFTGPGNGVSWTALLGGALVILGLVLLVLLSTPRRAVVALAYAGVTRRRRDVRSRLSGLGGALAVRAARTARWMLGR
ncbi:MAG TPA: hypothetical protein VN768_06200 [Acidimicrobiales bacterium]|nr:hypothetical protein [Acidimicrobiales bacterium]